jgi:transcriptional regulator GlxA family with amidase domain
MAAELDAPPHVAQADIWDSLSKALTTHVVARFGAGDEAREERAYDPPVKYLNAVSEAASHRTQRQGGLARWQERRARELLIAQVGGRVSVQEIAAACGLSRGHFSTAFKRSMGQTPHRWLMSVRVEKAKSLLLQSPLSISEIATDCGFADQSHLTRVFTAEVGAAPGGWRRRNR